MLALPCYRRLSPVAASGLLVGVASLVTEHGF